MFEKRSHQLDAPGRVVELVAEPPEPYGLVAPAVPPVLNEGRNKVGNEPLADRREVAAQAENRPFLQPAVPRETCENHDAELDKIYEDDSRPPVRDFGQRPRRPKSLDPKQGGGDDDKQTNDHSDNV